MPATLQRPSSFAKASADREVRGQLQFDWLLGERQFWSLKAAAGLLHLSDSFIEKLWDQGQVSGHEFNAGRGERLTKRITRAFLGALLVRSARYTAEAKLQTFCSCLREFDREELQQIADAAYVEQQRRDRR
ncbi:MAG: hypothetical protein PHE83_05760 [Opitutaceae bacterium]|nr:hypothetical protein [Opitutaceae bacterium]